MIASPVAVDVEERLAVRLARGQPGELEQRRHEVDRAHLRLDDAGLEAGRREDERHLDDLVEERRAVHVVDALHVVLGREALAPRLAVVGEEGDTVSSRRPRVSSSSRNDATRTSDWRSTAAR